MWSLNQVLTGFKRYLPTTALLGYKLEYNPVSGCLQYLVSPSRRSTKYWHDSTINLWGYKLEHNRVLRCFIVPCIPWWLFNQVLIRLNYYLTTTDLLAYKLENKLVSGCLQYIVFLDSIITYPLLIYWDINFIVFKEQNSPG